MKLLSLLSVLSILSLSLRAFAADAPKPAGKQVYHVVSLKFKASATPEQIKVAEEAFADLKNKITTITSLHWGTNTSPEKLNKGYTHCFVLTFASEKDRDEYLPHPAHKAFGKILGPILEDVMVIDFVANE